MEIEALSPAESLKNLRQWTLLAMVLDIGLVWFLSSRGIELKTAHVLSWLAAAGWALLLSRIKVGRINALLVLALPLFLRAGIYELYNRSYPDLNLIHISAAAATGAVAFYWMLRILLTRPAMEAAALLAVAYSVTLRLLYLSIPNLLTEEAYYWKYAENLAPGYLDHPPAVAVLIWAGTLLFGPTELGVRIGAWVSWLAGAWFIQRTAKDLCGEKAALGAITLYAVLPYFFGSGFFMTPDAPLMLCWAGALFFLSRALLQERTPAWYGAGICFGLGMLSKYSIALLGASALVLLLVDPGSRRVLKSIHPYLAGLLALALFSPVIYWNATHEWASFMFQGPRRLQAESGFSLHLFLLHLLILLTPAGLVALIAWLRKPQLVCIVNPEHNGDGLFAVHLEYGSPEAEESSDDAPVEARRKRLFSLVLGVFPIAVFMLFSLRHEPKVNWTGPAFIALLPAIGASLWSKNISGEAAKLAKLWGGTIALLLVCYSAVLCFWAIGIPGVSYNQRMRKFFGWDDLAKQLTAVTHKVEPQTGKRPVLVGMDSHYLASEVGFYRAKEAYLFGQTAPEPTQGRNLFGLESLMYRYWSDPAQYDGRAMILVSRTQSDLNDSAIAGRLSILGPLEEIVVRKDGQPVGRYYYRMGLGYQR
jgi:dolichol-phosphate mannosyltransferase